MISNLGVVVIGRNEGDRLKVCLRSLLCGQYHIVYVDSGSDDDSVAFARSIGVDVIDLDLTIPFSAARARNEGYLYLINKYKTIEFIQFVDGDCEIIPDWMSVAYLHLQNNPRIASVCGRRRERYPEKTIYNQLCDIEWDTPVGLAKATGGDFMCRVVALKAVDGFNPIVIAGEEPEMCFRMRQKGWLIERLDVDMTLHDANMHTVRQWFKRYERSGHAYAQGFSMHGNSEEHYCYMDLLRIILWSLLFPLIVIIACLLFGVLGLLLLFILLVQWCKIYSNADKKLPSRIRAAYSLSLVFGKYPQLKGVISFCWKNIFGECFSIIEYKS